MKEHLLIAGCGYLGERLLEQALAAGHTVSALSKSAERADELKDKYEVNSFAADLGNKIQLQKVAEQLDTLPDWVVHCASSNRGGEEAYQRVFVEGSANLIEIFPQAQLAFTSSSSVYGQKDGSHVDEDSPTQPEKKTGQLLLGAEQQVLEAGGLVTRLSGLYGPERSYLLKNFLEGTASIHLLPEGSDDPAEGRYLNQIHIDDAARLILELLRDKKSGLYNLSNGETLRQAAVYRALAQRFSKELPPTVAPPTQSKRGWSHKIVCSNKLLPDGYKLSYPNYLESLNKDPRIVSSLAEPKTVTEQKSVLIIEDEESVRQLLETLLGHYGYRTYSAENGQEGVDVLSDKVDEIDLVVCDMKMPGLSGEETFLQIRNQHPDIPVLMCSGVDVNLNSFSDNPELRPDGCLTKPFSADTLNQVVSNHIRSRAA